MKVSNKQEQMIYQLLFNIHYNSKIFAIFIDQYGRKTFLEVDDSGNYIYPLIDEFIELHKIYNERNPFISYETSNLPIGYRLPIHTTQKVTFKECVRNSVGTIALSLVVLTSASLISSVLTSREFKLIKEEDQISIVVDYIDGALITNSNQLDSVLGYQTASIEQIVDAINSNDKIDDYYKQYAINLAKFIKNKYPQTDSRIFYENMKGVSVVVVKNDEMNKNIAGTYSSYDNIVSVREDHKDSEQVITHEFAHAYHNWREDTMLYPHYKNETFGFALDEAMTNKIINGIIQTDTYLREKKMLEYFLTCVDYNYYDYEREGISKLIYLLKEKYPTVDVDFIINSLDTMKVTFSELDQYIKIEDNIQLLDEIFNMCISNINFKSNNVYQSFINFVKLIDYEDYEELSQHYLDEYNRVLIENKYSKDKINNNIDDFIWMLNELSVDKSNFSSYVEHLDINEISKDDIYGPFKSFFGWGGSPHTNYLSSEEINNHFYSMLEIYNDFLYRNGYTREQTITKEKMEQKVNRYNGVKIIGYGITTDDILTPIVDIPNIDKVHNTNTKVLVLNNEGEIILLDKNDMKSAKYDESGVYQYNFIMSLFARLDEEKSDFNEEFWQKLFIIFNSEYKKIDFILNGEKIAADYLYGVNITIGEKLDGTNTFSLSSDSQSIIQDESTLSDVTISFVDYLLDYPYKNENMTSIELEEFLNEDYLKTMVAGNDLSRVVNSRFDNFTYDKENDVVDIHPAYYVIMDEEQKIRMNDVFLELAPEQAHVFIDGYLESAKEFIDTNVDEEAKIYFETVLNHYGILSKDQVDYHLSKSEILELYNNYSQDVYVNKDSQNNINSMNNGLK